MSGDTRPVRASENLDWEKLAEYLKRELPRVNEADERAATQPPSNSATQQRRHPATQQPNDSATQQLSHPATQQPSNPATPSPSNPETQQPSNLQVEQFPGGHSNLTYLLRFGGNEYVLRRPPFGPVPPRAHDMAREARVLAAVHPLFPLAPRPLVLCEDTNVIGSVFYVMERRHGVVIRTEEPPALANDTELRARISGSIVDMLADLHAIDVVANGLDALGKPAGFVARQIRGWTERWHGSKTSEVPLMESLAAWLEAHIPADAARPAIVHGDYKLDNVMLDARQLDRLAGVFDWEMSAIGDPLVDVGILLCYWVHVASAGDPAMPNVTARPGWFGREEILERYAARAQAPLDHIAVYEVFGVFKLAVVIQQIYARYVRGQTDDPRFATLGERVAALAQIATELAAHA